MSRVIESFGQAVELLAAKSPKMALNLLKLGYGANSIKLNIMPDKGLLPHQRYVSIINSRAIRRPLHRPDKSAVVNIFFPCEILHAMDIVPQFTEGLACYLNGAGCEHSL